jgi:tRNA pseudouridine38-40 synthase
MPAFKITIAYDGTDYVGWQRQATGASIQGLLEDALREFGDGDVAVAGAGRTDAGVHAIAQVASFSLAREVPGDAVVRALNAKLPDAIRVMTAAQVPASFHARFDARAKTYCYRIWNGDVIPPIERRYAWHVPGALDIAAMQRAANLLEGEHDFAAFQSAGSDVARTVRRVSASAFRDARSTFPIPDSALLEYRVTADGFLRHMVRAIVGSVIDVGRGRQTPEWMAQVLESRDRSTAGRTAPAHGLFLVSVDYADALAAEP